ncbi:glycosyltransferase [Paraclostridium bifermentans]|uniref:glycosyltransferase n=1 Tax=Paraclostridium bifermentans TaxID=1490 RepID=UPI00359C8042
MESKKVSVIMGVYNEKEEWVKKSIESIINQTYKNIEFIVILDNPQNKELSKLITKYANVDKRIRFYINEINLGLIKTLNKAIDLSEGEYIARMDADDISEKERIAKQVEFLEQNKDYSLVGAKLSYIDEVGKEINIIDKRPIEYKSIVEYCKYDNAFAHPTLMYKRDDIIRIGKYKNAEYAEDYDLILRFIVDGKKVCNIDERLLKYRIRDTGVSISKKNYQVTTTQYLQGLYKNSILNNTDYIFDEKYLDRLFEIDNTNKGIEIDNLHKKSLEYGDNGKKILKLRCIIKLILKSKKYRLWYKNKLITKIKFK